MRWTLRCRLAMTGRGSRRRDGPSDSVGVGAQSGMLPADVPSPPPARAGPDPDTRDPHGHTIHLGRYGLAFGAGVGSFFLLPEVPAPWLGTALVLASCLAAGPPLFRRRGGRRSVSGAVGLLTAFLLGFLWASIRTDDLLRHPFPEDLGRVPLTVEGRIASIPADLGAARRFLFRVERTLLDGRPVSFQGLVRLSWFEGAPDLRAGARWRLPVRLKPRHGFANPGGFDYERWLFAQGVKGTGSVRKGAEPRLLDPDAGPYWLHRWRQSFNDHLARVLREARSLPLVQALVTGDQSGFERTDWEVMARTGTSHLVAISGLNLALVAGVAFFLIRRVWARRPGLALALAAPRAAAAGAFLAAFAYAALAGFSVSTRRALIMAAVVFAVIFWGRTPRHWRGLVLALVGVLLLDPASVLSYGFWLSFAAVAVLLFNLGHRLPRRDLWSRWGRAQWAVALGLMPLLFLLFGRASAISPLVNLVAEPLFTLLLFPLVLTASLLSLVPGLELPLVWTAHLLDWCLDGLAWIAALPWAAVSLPQGPAWVWPAAWLAAALLLAPRGLPGRWLGLPLLAPLVLVRPSAPAPGEAWFTLLDVGQGLSAVVRTRDRTLVYDTGPGFEAGFNTGDLVVAPFLAAQGLGRVDVLILSHADRDHSGGAAGLLARVPADRILSGEPQALAITGAEPCRAGQGWEWSRVRFRVLSPASGAGGADGIGLWPGGNDVSCVLRVEAGGRSILLPGDIGKGVEIRLVQGQGPALESDVLVAGHHGSDTSTGDPFLDAIAPDLVLYSTGYSNRFGFPAREVQRRVAARDIRTLDTGSAGAIELRLGSDGTIQGPWTWRGRARRLWAHRPAENASDR